MLRALAHPTRLQIIDLLRRGEVCVCHIERSLDKRQAYISQQLMVLRQAGLVENRKEGLQVYYRLAGPQIADLMALFYGDVEEDGHGTLADCPCPICNAP